MTYTAALLIGSEMKNIMRITSFVLITGIAVCAGCSKHAAPQPTGAAPDVPATAGAPMQDNALIAAELEALNRQVQQKEYDAAVGALLTMSQMPKSEKQEAIYRARLRETETELLKKAQAGDAAAAQNVQMLGRMMTGR